MSSRTRSNRLQSLLIPFARGIDCVPFPLQDLPLDVTGCLVALEEVQRVLVVGALTNARAAVGGAQQVGLRAGPGSGCSEGVQGHPEFQALRGARALAVLVV